MRRMPVKSTVIAEVGYEDEVMEIRFNNGGIYRYFNISPEVCLNLLRADSKGRFFNQEIRGGYPCTRIRKGRPILRRS